MFSVNLFVAFSRLKTSNLWKGHQHTDTLASHKSHGKGFSKFVDIDYAPIYPFFAVLRC
jgi:hypothetical protein